VAERRSGVIRVALCRRIGRLEQGRAAQRNAQGLTPAEVGRERICRRRAEMTGRPYEDVLREHIAESKAYWKDYDGDGSVVDILRYRFRRRDPVALEIQQ
jgi:hypothetical protein